MNGSRIASRSTPSSVSLPAQSLRAASSAGLLPAGHAATSPFAIDVARSWSPGLAVHAASATSANVYVGFIESSLHFVNRVTRVSAPASTVNVPGQVTSSIAYGGSTCDTPCSVSVRIDTWGCTPSTHTYDTDDWL